MHRNAKRQTKAERARNDRIMGLHCIVCALSGDFTPRKLECQHIVRGNKRLGHWFTIPLCLGHHQGKWTDQVVRVGIANGRHAFKEAHGYDELELWQKLQVTLCLDDTLPSSKIVARKNHGQGDSQLPDVGAGRCQKEPVVAGAHDAERDLDALLDRLGDAVAAPAVRGSHG